MADRFHPDDPTNANDASNADTVVDYVRFGRFRVEALLGSEGMGTVEKAFDTILRVTVALKTIRPALAQSAPAEYAELRERFRREAVAGAQLRDSRYLVQVYELGGTEETPYLVQEYVPGGDLRRLLKARGRLPVEHALAIAADAARGLGEMHAHNLIHRDVKPANIFLTADERAPIRAKIGDFGIVQDGVTHRSSTTAKTHPSTTAYASPEQMTSTGYLLPASDQYSLGLVLFEMLTGRRYRDFNPPSAADAILATLPPGVVAIFRRMTAERPDARYANMEVVANVLSRVNVAPSPRQTTGPLPSQPRPETDGGRGTGGNPNDPGDTVIPPPVVDRAPLPPAALPPTDVPPAQPAIPPAYPPPQPIPPVYAAQPPVPPHGPAPYTPVSPGAPPPPYGSSRSSRRGVLVGAAVLLLGAAGGAAFARNKGVLGSVTATGIPATGVADAGTIAATAPVVPATVAPSPAPSPTTLVTTLAPAPPSPSPSPLPPVATNTAVPPMPTLPAVTVPPPAVTATPPSPPVMAPPTAAPPPPPPPATTAPPTGTAAPRTVTNPTNGTLTIKPPTYNADSAMVNVRDATINATFQNPAAGDKQWSYGFVFRRSDRQLSIITLLSTGLWQRSFATLKPDGTAQYDNRKLLEGSVASMKRGATDANDVQLLLNNKVGELLVNGVSVAALNLSDAGDAGDVRIAAGLSTTDQAGLNVKYRNFYVNRAPPPSAFAQRAETAVYGPANGAIRHDGSNSNVQQIYPNVFLRDATISARFFNPYAASRGAWDGGFSFRRSDTKYYRIRFRSDKTWLLSYGTKATSDTAFRTFTDLQMGAVPSLRVNAGESNDVVLTLKGGTGTLLVNGPKVGDLDLGANTDEGEITLGIHYSDNSVITGETTRYESFIITTP